MLKRRQLFLSCEHGGNRVPRRYQMLFQGLEEQLDSHRGFDPGALFLARLLARALHAPLEAAETTRLLVDLNRSRHNAKLFSAAVRQLPVAEKEQLLANYYHPYRQAVSDRISDRIAAGAQVVHLSVHSFTPILHGQVRNAELGLLYDPARVQERLFCQDWRLLLKQQQPTLRVRCNYPYRGTADGLVRVLRGQFSPQDYLGIELEVNQGLLADKKSFPAEVQTALLETLQELFAAA
ncbi:MAG TPA: N-formylglutamate amidohydrolase [Malonomonas sp.]